MEKAFVQYGLVVYTYGALRTAVYAPPMKKDDYVTERVGRAIMYTATAPFVAPIWMCADLKNIEHVVRDMPGPIDRSPWG